ncbi:hypothetical protein NC653_040499 [Populus alba x Populus x berolinensis]|uniref:Uncharacterized protein n=1 Tax=Populus alba x Populus x berolinensis TaxID=444605 RepID=A0AAD6L697_9ROSI|nr:hypothetical protein NC653_040499 [Populus alba x Populus x berolinensis]
MTRNRVDAESTDRGECEEDLPMALISFHGCSLDGKVKMTSDNFLADEHNLQEEKRKMVASAFGKDQSGGSATCLTVEDLKYLYMV